VNRFFQSIIIGFGLIAFAALVPLRADASTLSLVPSKTELEVGETFEVAVLLDTQGEDVNAVEIGIDFPADKLQVVSPNTGRSIIEIWAGQPKFNNKTGQIEMRGGIPNGLVIENGLVTTIQFRVKTSGSASVQFTTQTRVLANDGLGTDVLVRTPGAFLTAKLPKPAGPVVTSPTHSEQSRWYVNPDIIFEWQGDEGIEGYSYILNDEAVFEPDTISEGQDTDISYNQLGSGVHFFHIRSLRAGQWGGTTHFQVNIDNAPPANFKIEAIPSSRTAARQPVLKFFTTDAQSGIDHFEIKIISLTPTEDGQPPADELFSDAQSPYVMYPLELGNYDVIVRAYDKARNYREVSERLIITTPIFSLLQDDGLRLTENYTLTWPWIWLVSFLILMFFIFTSWRLRHWPRKLGMHHKKDEVPDVVQRQLDELRAYQKKYGKIAVMLLFVATLAFGGRGAVAASAPFAAGSAVLTPPLIVTVSNDITTADTFYIGGETVVPNTDVVVYWNNLTTGETQSALTEGSESGEWFYHHPGQLAVGNYVLWAQSRVGETVSPPSPQFTMVVRSDAIRIGPARISYEFAYLSIIGLLLAVIFIIGLLTIHKWHIIKVKHRQFMAELRASEESIRRGFAVLRRDLELEFAAIKATGTTRKLTHEEQAREKQIVTDIEVIQNKIGKEIWELEKLENSE
jgi:hypothetical protein